MEGVSNRSPRRLPSEIYFRRRLAAVVAILVVVGLVVAGLVAFANRGGDETPPPSPAAETTSFAEESTPTSTETSAETSKSEEPSAELRETEAETESETATSKTQAAAGRDTCELSDLRITASTDQPSYGGNRQPTFYMSVENPTEADCVVDLSDDELRFEVYDLADNQRVWADTDCFPPVMEEEETFEAGKERSFQAVWSRLGSQPGQCDNRTPVESGAYFLHAVIGTNPSDAHPFNLS